MRRGFKCRKDVLLRLKQAYENIVKNIYLGDFLEALKNFDEVSEKQLRDILSSYYPNERSRNQAWKTCKGSLYEYAVFRYVQHVIEDDANLKDKIRVEMGDDVIDYHKDQVVIKNWSDIFPDVDILLVSKETKHVLAIISCKTSLRERLTETAFWKRELEQTKGMKEMKLVFVTTDKDNELKTETNRYILLHVVDYTFITNPEKYDELIRVYKKKYGHRPDFRELINKVKQIDKMKEFLYTLIKSHT